MREKMCGLCGFAGFINKLLPEMSIIVISEQLHRKRKIVSYRDFENQDYGFV